MNNTASFTCYEDVASPIIVTDTNDDIRLWVDDNVKVLDVTQASSSLEFATYNFAAVKIVGGEFEQSRRPRLYERYGAFRI